MEKAARTGPPFRLGTVWRDQAPFSEAGGAVRCISRSPGMTKRPAGPRPVPSTPRRAGLGMSG